MIIRRVTTKPVEEYIEKGKSMYASISKTDAAAYKALFPKINRPSMPKGMQYYESMYKAKHDIKVISRKKAYEIYSELRDEYYKTAKPTKWGLLGLMENPPPSYPGYELFSERLIDRENSETKKFMERVMARGYNAVFDENDYARISGRPIILFSPGDDLIINKTRKVNKIDESLSSWRWLVFGEHSKNLAREFGMVR